MSLPVSGTISNLFAALSLFSVPNYVPAEHVAKATAAIEREIELGRVIVSEMSRFSETAAIDSRHAEVRVR